MDTNNKADPVEALRREALFGSLSWLVETFREEIAPYSATTNLDEQVSKWWCHGCEGVFESRWPQWTEPTDETFPHEQNCKYMQAVRLTQAKPNIEDDRRRSP